MSNILEDGKIVLVVSGWNDADVRNSAAVLQQFESFNGILTDNKAVKITSVSVSGITPVQVMEKMKVKSLAELVHLNELISPDQRISQLQPYRV